MTAPIVTPYWREPLDFSLYSSDLKFDADDSIRWIHVEGQLWERLAEVAR